MRDTVVMLRNSLLHAAHILEDQMNTNKQRNVRNLFDEAAY